MWAFSTAAESQSRPNSARGVTWPVTLATPKSELSRCEERRLSQSRLALRCALPTRFKVSERGVDGSFSSQLRLQTDSPLDVFSPLESVAAGGGYHAGDTLRSLRLGDPPARRETRDGRAAAPRVARTRAATGHTDETIVAFVVCRTPRSVFATSSAIGLLATGTGRHERFARPPRPRQACPSMLAPGKKCQPLQAGRRAACQSGLGRRTAR